MARVDVRGISGRIDGCEKLLYKQTNQMYARINEEHQNWISPEDVLQEGLIAAWKAEQKYAAEWGAPTKGEKLGTAGKRSWPTYMAYGVRNRFTATFVSPLSQQKRLSLGGVQSLDAVIPGTENLELGETLRDEALSVLDKALSAEQVEVGISTFGAIGRRLKGTSAAFFVTVMCFGQWPSVALRDHRKIRAAVQDIRRAALAVGGMEQMIDASTSNYYKRKTLTLAMEFTNMRKSDGCKVKILDCRTCRGLFSLEDVERGKFIAETLTCSGCYRKMAASVPERSCFGKIKTKEHEGYDANDPECRLHCMDRGICRNYLERKEGKHMSAEQLELIEEEDEVGIDGTEDDLSGLDDEDAVAEKPVKESKPKKAAGSKKVKTAATKPVAKKAAKTANAKPAKSAKPAAKPAKAAKAVNTAKKDGTKAPVSRAKGKKEKTIKLDETTGLDLPFKTNSAMRYSLVQALQKGGIKAKELESKLTKLGYKAPFQMKMLRSGQSNGKGLLPYPVTHTWTVTEENGIIKAHNVKRVATFAKLERVYATSRGTKVPKTEVIKKTPKAGKVKKAAHKKAA